MIEMIEICKSRFEKNSSYLGLFISSSLTIYHVRSFIIMLILPCIAFVFFK